MEASFFLLDIDYRIDGDEVVTRLYGKTKAGERIVVHDKKTKPYFYILPRGKIELLIKRLGELRVNGKGFLSVESVEKGYAGGSRQMVKVFLRNPQEVPAFREAVVAFGDIEHTLEKDIVFTRRYMIDKGLSPFREVVVVGTEAGGVIEADSVSAGPAELASPKLMAIDIEVYNPRGEPRADKDPIIAISMASDNLRKVLTWKGKNCQDFVEVLADEKAVIERFAELVREADPDVITGYYCDQFDFPYIYKRAHKLKAKLCFGATSEELRIAKRGRDLAPTCFGRLMLDVFPYISNIMARSLNVNTLTLNDVATDILGEGKEKLGYAGILSSWEKEDIPTLASYALKDSELALALGQKLLPNVYELAKLIHIPLYDVLHMTSGQIVEWSLISAAYGEGIVVPNRPKQEEVAARRQSSYEGAFVREPVKGIHENIAVCDFRSLYPSIIVSHNIDPFTLNVRGCASFSEAPTGQKFCKDGRGFVPQTLEKLLKLRFELKDRLKATKKGTAEYSALYARQNGLKLIANSTYGYMGYSGARWYSLACAEAITAWARMYIKQTMEAAEKAGFAVLYGDTDSLFISSKEKDFEAKASAFVAEINRSLPASMELELEGIYLRGVFLTKKRYAMLSREGALIVKGLERVRRDWAPIAKKTQEAVIRAILEKNDPALAKSVVEEAVAALRSKKVPLSDIIIYTPLTKDPGDYKITSPHVSAAMRKKGAFRAGMSVGFVIVPGGGKKISNNARLVDEVKEGGYDPDYYIDNQLLPAVTRILEAVGADFEGKKPQTKLSKFW